MSNAGSVNIRIKAHSGARKKTRLLAGVSRKDVVESTRGLAVMLKARLTLTEALKASAEQTHSRALRDTLDAVRKDVQAGRSLSAGLKKHPKVFETLFVHLVEVGEAAGILDSVMLRLAAHIERTEALRRKIRMALVYPAVVLMVAATAVSFMLIYVVPTFADMFRDFGAELPAPTRIVLGASNFLSRYFFLLFLLLSAGILLFRYYVKSPNGRLWWHGVLLKVPVVGKIIVYSTTVQFCRTMGTLIQSGVPLTDALKIMSNALGNAYFERAISNALKSIVRGRSLIEPLRKSALFPPMVLQMIAAGESTAELDTMFHYVADYLAGEIDTVVDTLTSLLEPILILIVGAILGGILAAMYLPMFEMVNVIG